MKINTAALVLTLTLIPFALHSQTHSDKPLIDFLPGGLHFKPLMANTYEPRVGFIFQADKSDLRLDISNSIDLIDINVFQTESERLSLGGDFFTWTALRQDENFHFPVDAVDYLFGLNLSYSNALTSENTLQARLRWSHISAHLVDGRYNKATGEWLNGQLPRVYSREYFELIAAFDYQGSVRPYVGFTYVYHIDPADLGKAIYQLGVEATLPDAGARSVHPYFAYDMRIVDVYGASTAHSIQLGVKAGQWNGKGINVFVAYYTGMNIHGEYHDQSTEYWGPGILLDF